MPTIYFLPNSLILGLILCSVCAEVLLKDCKIFNRTIRVHVKHTACLTRSNYSLTTRIKIYTIGITEKPSIIPQDLSKKWKDLILKKLNRPRTRQLVHEDNLVWDDELADLAHKWSMQCQTKSDQPENRVIPYKGPWNGVYDVDQVLLKNVSSVDDFLEHRSVKSKVQRSTYSKVGCAWTHCSERTFQKIFICNFSHGRSESLRKKRDTSSRNSDNDNSGMKRFRSIGNRIRRNGNNRITFGNTSDNVTVPNVECSGQRFECSIVHDRPDIYNWMRLCRDQPDFAKGCPFMCGKCNTCQGFYCKNHGILVDTLMCICECEDGYSGTDCSICQEDRPYTFDSERCLNED